MLQKDFRTQFINPPNPDFLLQLHPGDFVFAEWREGTPKILHLLSNGTTEWINKPFALGSGQLFAYALLQKYQGFEYNLEKASVLAYKVIEESIETGAWGLGYPIDIYQITDKGIKNLDKEEISALDDICRGIREAEIKLLLRDETYETN
ncbi:MAG: hypothetical protein ABIM02_05985 [candidate division WOR-3 bacterium]